MRLFSALSLLAALTPALTPAPLVAQDVPAALPVADSPDDIDWVAAPAEALPDGVEHRTFRSTSMDREVGYVIFLPAEALDGPVPVFYWLGSSPAFEEELPLVSALADAISEGRMPPTAVVLANGAPGAGYLDNPATGIMGESVVVRELIPHVEDAFGVGGAPGARGIGGLGIGGGAAVRLALRNPDTFGAILSLGGAMMSASEIQDRYGVSASVAADADPFALSIEVAPRLRRIDTWLRAGSQDPWVAANRRFAAHLGHQNLDVDYIEVPRLGGTLEGYLDAIGPDLVRFLARSLD